MCAHVGKERRDEEARKNVHKMAEEVIFSPFSECGGEGLGMSYTSVVFLDQWCNIVNCPR